MMVKKLRELQFLCAILLFMQLVFYHWGVLFHSMAVIVSVIVICNTKLFRCIDARYNYWIIGLFLYRICIHEWYYVFSLFPLLYTLGVILIMTILIICTCRCVI